jgi:hypothetical protein
MIVLQKFGFKESKYERPQDKWICGHMADGKPCTLGPGKNGACRVTTACQPFQEKGRWQCRRSPQEGGPCEIGPFPNGTCSVKLEPCVPVPSLRTTRKRIVLWAMGLAVGISALIVAGGNANRWLMPGQLSSQHESLAGCSSCHAGTGPGKTDWMHQIVASVSPEQNAKLCTTCHDVGKQPFAPHTHPVEELKQITKTLTERKPDPSLRKIGWTQRIAYSRPAWGKAEDPAEIYCSTCHREHQGEVHDLTKVSNERCQTCHVSKFGAFADSHPQFAKYPYSRRTRIIFDHQSHIGKNFAEAAKATPPAVAPTACTDCHQPGLERRTMQVRTYAAMCSGCHNNDILGTTRSGSKGIDFLAVPGLDMETLIKRRVDIGQWPKNAEGTLTPFMLLLFASRGETAPMELAGTDLIDLSSATDEQLAKVKELAWAVKRLFNRLETEQLEEAIGSGGDTDRLRTAALTGAISHDVIAGANREWFPKLQEELARFEKKEAVRTTETPEKTGASLDPEAWASFGGWYRQDFTIRYRPAGHADQFLRTWLDFTSRGSATPQGALLTPIFQQLVPQDAVGRCSKCHSIDDEAGAKRINWRAFEGKRTRNRFTTFAHKPHIAAVGDKGCVTCHKLSQQDSEFLATFKEGDPNSYTPNFLHMDKAVCATCHSKQTHWQNCTLCHAYHVGEFNDAGLLRRASEIRPMSPSDQEKGQ